MSQPLIGEIIHVGWLELVRAKYMLYSSMSTRFGDGGVCVAPQDHPIISHRKGGTPGSQAKLQYQLYCSSPVRDHRRSIYVHNHPQH
jgi:hypothetical protein